MSQLLITAYFNELDRLKKATGSLTEGVISEAFKDLLKSWARQAGLVFASQLEAPSPQKNRIVPDGTILHDLRVPLGYWEAKDTADDLDAEIRNKLAKGYPQDNIIFENSETAVLIQNRQEAIRCDMRDPQRLAKLVELFFAYERKEIAEFRKAVAQFSVDLPAVLEALRAKIDDAYSGNPAFKKAANAFLKQAKSTINPSVSEADVREMLIQHILTEEIFAHVFNEGDFHRENNIAKELYALEAKFFTGAVKKDTLKALETYYGTIRANAALITSHAEKQTFLKLIYERFYKVYNPKAADRLGVVYTPNEIVKFMIEGADWLCEKHFGKSLIDPHVEILDPATGTGTFICELLEHFRGQPAKLAHKYKNELHANEVAILPYYVANLNIEATYAAITGQFAEFPNLCFVDTLDNTAGLGIRAGYQHDMFGAMSDENVERIKRQNARKISVVIGNPPYNANQQNENDNNKNREYKRIDEVIKYTYIKHSTAQKTKVYDMYARFFRWASDRMHDDGVLAFITNRSFIESRTFDGFRKCVADEFAEIYVVDLGGDVRANPKLSGTKHNVFGIQTGVAISFFVKKAKVKAARAKTVPTASLRAERSNPDDSGLPRRPSGLLAMTGESARIFYARRPEMEIAEDKLAFIGSNAASRIAWQQIKPDAKNNWLGQTDNDWDSLTPVADKKTKAAKTKGQEKALFRLFSFGLVTNRDDWLFGRATDPAEARVRYLIDQYNSDRKAQRSAEKNNLSNIKWTRSVKRQLSQNTDIKFSDGHFVDCLYRPFDRQKLFFLPSLIEMLNQTRTVFGAEGKKENQFISFSDPTSQKPFMLMAGDTVFDMHLVGAASGAMGLPLYRYTPSGERIDNITDWGLAQFVGHYGKDKARPITRDAVFHYVYAVLHDPVYREKYALNLKRDFPRVPFYPDFWAWAAWGEALMALHIGYEAVEPWPIKRIDVPDEKARAAGVKPKPILKSLKDEGVIRLDSETTLTGIPPVAFTYLLGNRSGLDWILDQYKEKTPKDPTIREKFNTYRFADYKEKVIDLIARVTRVSVETMTIIEAMKAAQR